MKITDLIRELITTLKEYGDIEVRVAIDTGDGDFNYGIPRIISDEHDDHSVDIVCGKTTYN